MDNDRVSAKSPTCNSNLENLRSNLELRPGTPWRLTVGTSSAGYTQSPRTLDTKISSVFERLTTFKHIEHKDDNAHFIAAAFPQSAVPLEYTVADDRSFVPVPGAPRALIEPGTRALLVDDDGEPLLRKNGRPRTPTFRRLQFMSGHTGIVYVDFDGEQAYRAGKALREASDDGKGAPIKTGVPLRWVADKSRVLRSAGIAHAIYTSSSHRKRYQVDGGGTYQIPAANCKVRFVFFVDDTMETLDWREIRDRHLRIADRIARHVLRVGDAGIPVDPASERPVQVMYGPAFKDPSRPRFARARYGAALSADALLALPGKEPKRKRERDRREPAPKQRRGDFDRELDEDGWLADDNPRLAFFLREVKRCYPEPFEGESGERDRFRAIVFLGYDCGIPEDQTKHTYIESALNAKNPEPVDWDTLSGYWHLDEDVTDSALGVFGERWNRELLRLRRLEAVSQRRTPPARRCKDQDLDLEFDLPNLPPPIEPSYSSETKPEQRAAIWWETMGALRSGVIRAPVGSGKGLLRVHLQAAATALGMPFTVAAPAVSLTYDIADSDALHHYSNDVSASGATSPFALMHIVDKGGVEAIGFCVLDEARKVFALLFSTIGFSHDSRRVLRLLAHLWCHDRLLLTCADFPPALFSKWLTFVVDYADKEGLEAPEPFYLNDPHPVLHKTVKRITAQQLVSAIHDLPKNTKAFCANTRKTDANTIANMVGDRAFVLDADQNADVNIDEQFTSGLDIACVSPAAATGLNVRTTVDFTALLHAFREVSPYDVAQILARVRDNGEVLVAMPEFKQTDERIDDPDELREQLQKRAEHIKTLAPLRNVANGAFEDKAFLELWVEVEAQLNFEYNNHREVLERILERYGWDYDLDEPEEVTTTREEDSASAQAARDARERVKRCEVKGSVMYRGKRIQLADAKAELAATLERRRAAKQALREAVGTYPDAYAQAKKRTQKDKVDRIAKADLNLAKDEHKHVGKPQADRRAAKRRQKIEDTHGIDASAEENREVVEADVEGKLSARIERAALARLHQAGTPDLHLYDAKVWAQFKRTNDEKLGSVLRNDVQERQTSYKVFEAEFLAALHEAVTGFPVGHGRTPEGYFPQLSYRDDYIERAKAVFESDAFVYAHPRKRPPQTDAAIARSVASHMRRFGSVERGRRGKNDRYYLFQLEMGAVGLNEATILADLERKRAEKTKKPIEIKLKTNRSNPRSQTDARTDPEQTPVSRPPSHGEQRDHRSAPASARGAARAKPSRGAAPS